jgi:hypothetical protein
VECSRKKPPQIAHHHDIPATVTITRERHAFEGQSLTVINSIRRRGDLLLLVSLPDGSRSLIPARWSDWRKEGGGDDGDDSPLPDDAAGSRDLGRLSDLLHLSRVFDAFRRRLDEPALPGESHHAVDPCVSRPDRTIAEPPKVKSSVKTVGPSRRSLSNGGTRNSRTIDRPNGRHRLGEGNQQ